MFKQTQRPDGAEVVPSPSCDRWRAAEVALCSAESGVLYRVWLWWEVVSVVCPGP